VVEEVGIGAALVGLSLFVPGGFLAAGSLLSGVGGLASILASAGAGMVLSGVGTLLGQKASGISTTSRNPLAPWQCCYGRKKVGGTIVYLEETADSNRIMTFVVVVACHAIDEIEEIWFNNRKLPLETDHINSDTSNPQGFRQSFVPPQGNWQIETISRINDVVSVTFAQNPNSQYLQFNGETMQIRGTIDAAGGSTFEGYYPVVQTGPASLTYTAGGPPGAGVSGTGHITSTWPAYPTRNVIAGYYTGDQTTASGIILGNTRGYWTSQCLLTGRAYVALKLNYDANVYTGLPEFSFVIRGKNDIYDPRTGTKGYTNNAALCIADYLAHPLWGYNDYYESGPQPQPGEPKRFMIPDAQLIAAANICDEQVQLASGAAENRYSCDGAWDVSVLRAEVLQNLLTSCGGRLVEIGGQHLLMPAAWVSPSGAVTIGNGTTGPLMMMNSLGLVAEYFNNPVGVYIPDCAGSTESQFVYALGLLNAYQAVGNSNAKALAQLILSAIVPFLFRGMQPPPQVTATNIWSPNSYFDVKQPFLAFDGSTISVTQDFASTIEGGWRTLVGAEIQTSCDAYNWAMRLFGLAALIFDGATDMPSVDPGYGLSPYGSSYGDPEVPGTTINSGWLIMLAAIQQMARIAYNVPNNPGSFQGGMIPMILSFVGTPAPVLDKWLGPAYVGYQSPWAVNQVNPAAVANAIEFIAESQATLAVQGTIADTVTFTVTGPNARTLAVPVAIKPDGTASAQFSYAGLSVGTDSIVATLPSHSLTSNQARIAWSAYAAPMAVYGMQIAVMGADGSGLFNGLSAVLSTTPVEGLMFNSHPQSVFPGDPHQNGNTANPFVNNVVSTTGSYAGSDTAIPNTGGKFNAVITGFMTIETAGSYSFLVYVNSAFVIGFNGGVSYVSGFRNLGALSAGTAQLGFPALAGLNNAGDFPGSNWAVVNFTLNFPNPGIYAFEIDYASGLFSERQFVMVNGSGGVIPNVGIITGGGSTSATGTAPSGQLQLTPYSGGYAIGQTANFNLSLTGITYAAPTEGPFMPVYQYPVAAGAQTWGPVGVFGYFGPDPNFTAGYYQYRPLAELCDLIAGAKGTEPWYTSSYAQAVNVKNSFLSWLNASWTSYATGPPNYFPQTGPQTTAVDIHCAALILYSVLTLDLALRPTGAGGEGAMDSTGFALLTKVYNLLFSTYNSTGPMAGTFCLNPTGAQDWSPIWSGELLRALSLLVNWATINGQPVQHDYAVIWIDGLIDFGLNNVVVVDRDLGYTVNDLRGAVSWKPTRTRAELFNGIKGSYISEANQWQQSDVPSYAQDNLHGYTNGTPEHDGDLNWDNDGDRRWADRQLPFTTSVSMAQRLFKIELMRIRQQGTGAVAGLMGMYKSAPLDTAYFSFVPFQWLNKVLEIANCRLVFPRGQAEGSGIEVSTIGVELDIQESDPSVYEFSVTEELNNFGYSYVPGLQDIAPD
jgi:hypothetical protein